MPVKIGKGTKIGDNNAIGDNTRVNISNYNKNTKKREKEDLTWFGRHPWLSAIICSVIASIIMFLNWDKIFTFIKGQFSS